MKTKPPTDFAAQARQIMHEGDFDTFEALCASMPAEELAEACDELGVSYVQVISPDGDETLVRSSFQSPEGRALARWIREQP